MFEPSYLASAIIKQREREVEAILLSNLARQPRPHTAGPLYRRILASLGAHLIAWGQKLQQTVREPPRLGFHMTVRVLEPATMSPERGGRR